MDEDIAPMRALNPAKWQWHARLADGTWLTQPKNAAPGNTETWTRCLEKVWPFDSEKDAREAALSHGAKVEDLKIIASPRKAGDWLKLKNDWAPLAA